MPDRRRTARHKHLAGTDIARHLDDLSRRSATHDTVVDEEDALAGKLEGHGIELPAHILAAHALTRHNKGAANVPIFHKAFAIRNMQRLRQLQRSHPRRVRHGDDHINLLALVQQLLLHLLRQSIAHRHAASVHTYTVNHTVGPGKVDIFENVGRERVGCRLRDERAARDILGRDDNSFTRLDILKFTESKRVGHDTLAGKAVVVAVAASLRTI